MIVELLISLSLAINSISAKLEQIPVAPRCDTAREIHVVIIDDSTYWKKVSPLAFLDTLVQHPGKAFIIYSSPPPNWFVPIPEKKWEELMRNNAAAAEVISVYANRKATGVSTLAREAKEMKRVFGEKRYPSTY